MQWLVFKGIFHEIDSWKATKIDTDLQYEVHS